MPSKTFGSLRREAAARLREASIENAEVDARLLLLHAAKLDAAKLISAENEKADEDLMAVYEWLLAQRISGMPVARITGEKEFWSLRFALGADTLVPRSETEIIVEAALGEIEDKQRALRILDLGTGTGAILAALLMELPNAHGIAADKSEAALRVARSNLRNLSLDRRVSYICGDWASAIDGTFDLIVSNPPYIMSKELALLSPEVRDHDPLLALDGGQDGLDAYRTIINQLCKRLAKDGIAVLELGQGGPCGNPPRTCYPRQKVRQNSAWKAPPDALVSLQDSIRYRFRSKGSSKQPLARGPRKPDPTHQQTKRETPVFSAKPRAKHPRLKREISGRMTNTNTGQTSDDVRHVRLLLKEAELRRIDRREQRESFL
jgi:release factor glutamine methyltransferase